MKSPQVAFVCSNCGRSEPKWLGRCPACSEWNTFDLQAVVAASGKPAATLSIASPEPLADVTGGGQQRLRSGIAEWDRAVGGGLVPGSTIMVGGEPGVGKSTLLLQLAGAAAAALSASTGTGGATPVLYITAEEAPAQLKLRAERVAAPTAGIAVWAGAELDALLSVLDRDRPRLLIVDSLQTLGAPESGLLPGSVATVKHCAQQLASWTRQHGAVCLLVAHVTKEGSIAGPRAVEHLVDVVLLLEPGTHDLRLVRATKNRFGSVDEVGIFAMTEGGMREVPDPNSWFMVARDGPAPAGVAVAPVFEGSRVLAVEVQCLATPAKGATPRIYSDRIDVPRVSRLAAVLERHTRTRLSGLDLYVNVAGGMRVRDVAADLPLALALFSAVTGTPLLPGAGAFGEVSLAGEVGAVPAADARRRALAELGFDPVLTPPAAPAQGGAGGSGGGVRTVASVAAAIRCLVPDD